MVKETFRKNEIDIAVIPGGLTSKLQPLDVMINHSFKAKVNKLLFAVLRFTFTIYNSSFILLLTVASQSYNEWMINEAHEMTRSGRIKRPSYSAVAKQSLEASFKCCGISLVGDDQERLAL